MPSTTELPRDTHDALVKMAFLTRSEVDDDLLASLAAVVIGTYEDMVRRNDTVEAVAADEGFEVQHEVLEVCPQTLQDAWSHGVPLAEHFADVLSQAAVGLRARLRLEVASRHERVSAAWSTLWSELPGGYDPGRDSATQDRYDAAIDTAIHLLAAAGFGPDDPDVVGDAIGDAVQTHLQMAFLRAPAVGDAVHRLLADRP